LTRNNSKPNSSLSNFIRIKHSYGKISSIVKEI
jgi:hypothetical protein